MLYLLSVDQLKATWCFYCFEHFVVGDASFNRKCLSKDLKVTLLNSQIGIWSLGLSSILTENTMPLDKSISINSNRLYTGIYYSFVNFFSHLYMHTHTGLFLRWFITISRDWQIRVALGLLWTVHMFRGRISQLPTYPKLRQILWAAVLLVRPDGNLVGCWLWISRNKLADICSDNSHQQIFYHQPVHQIFRMACQPCKQTHVRSDTYTCCSCA